jgi:hypothetical protein
MTPAAYAPAKQIGRPSDKFCMDIICLVILLGVASVIYNMAK